MIGSTEGKLDVNPASHASGHKGVVEKKYANGTSKYSAPAADPAAPCTPRGTHGKEPHGRARGASATQAATVTKAINSCSMGAV